MNHNQPTPHPIDKDHPSEAEIHAFLDDELTPSSRRRLKRHAAECSQCREALNKLKGLFDHLEETPAYPLREDLSVRIIDQLRSERESLPALPWIASLQTALAAVLLSLTIPTFLKSPHPSLFFGRWSQGILLIREAWLEVWGGWDANLQALRIHLSAFLSAGSAFPSLDLSFAPLWAFFLIAALLGILGNTLLLGKVGQVSNGNHT